MPETILIGPEETVVCPKCSYHFPLHQGIAKQTIERYEKAYDSALQERTEELKVELGKAAEKEAVKKHAEQVSQLNEELETARQSLEESELRNKKVKADAEAKAQREFELERKVLQEELQEKTTAIDEFRKEEMALRREKKRLQEDRESLELDLQRKLDLARQDIEKRVGESEAEKFKYKEAEFKQQLESAVKANEELTRKLEQGSQQLQGEVLETELESLLRTAFPHDDIQEVAKGARGADIVQRVYTPNGQFCGTILWEAKRAQNWSEKWLQKLRDDRLTANADIAVLACTRMPKDCREPFQIMGDVWVASDRVVRPVAETLRVMLIQTNALRLSNLGKAEKMELLYNYLSSSNFAQKVGSTIEAFSIMKQDLEKEKAAMYRAWRRRESQLERVTVGMATMVGELQAIAQHSLPLLDSIDQLLLPEGSDSD